MKKFMALYMAPVAAMEEMMKNSTPEQQQAGMAQWNAWLEANKDNLPEGGAALGRNTRLTKDSAVETRNEVGGYSIIHADSKEEAIKVAQNSPNFSVEGAYVELMEVIEM